jgi:hypothetical protein
MSEVTQRNTGWLYTILTDQNKVWAILTGKKFATLAGGCAPEASTLPPVTVSRIFLTVFRGESEDTNLIIF